uniref:Zn(2)-C6 fungal-type domain-containing protein n=1 Tax=Verticillium longisporum TaxID=100787 RepID=L0PQH2_VERLO|nr:hypothetical protein [Verticillium longisporum]CCK33055.1 hypothetical protein [Verticillium longisporum]CCK33057.2 hypothetical protein [Verticillium longisporum]
MSSSSKTRQPRLRASCDGCFLAKVKCSKARPMCSRCLSCGLECNYSPSSRAGKPKADHSSNSRLVHLQTPPTSISTTADENAAALLRDIPVTHPLYKIDTDWDVAMDFADTFSNPLFGRGPLNPCEANGLDTLDPGNVTSIYSNNLPWTPPNDFASINYTDLSYTGTNLSGPQSCSVSMDDTTSQLNSWVDSVSRDTQCFGATAPALTPASMSSSYFPSPSSTPPNGPSAQRKVSSKHDGANFCTCFTVCLQSLQDMHSASSPDPPPFDVVLSLNRRAVDSCAALLACAPCLSRSGTHTTAMLLATIIGKITSFYQKATHSYFDGGVEDGIAGQGNMHGLSSTGASLGISLGAYTLGGEDGRWLELEILARELHKLEEVYAQFRDVCGELTEDPEVSRAMIGYLGHNLGTTLKVVSHRKGGMKRA